MALKLIVVVIILSFGASVSLGSSYDLNACTYTGDDGKIYDLSPLIPQNETGYMFTQTLYDTTDNILTNTAFSDPVKVTLQVHVCRNVTKTMNGNCTAVGPAPVYMINDATGQCFAYGNIKTANIQPNPFKDGVFIDYYGGEAVDHITQYSSRLYFVCKQGTKLEGPTLEHVKDSYCAHIRFNTEIVC